MTWGLLHTHKKLYLHQIQSVKKKQLTSKLYCTSIKTKIDQFTETINQGLYIDPL